MTKKLPENKKKKRTRNNPGHGGHFYTRIQKNFIIKNGGMPRKELCDLFNKRFKCNISHNAMKATCLRMGLKADNSGRYQKGNVPWTKGTKGVCKPNSGSFKKGHKPANKKKLGHIRICPKDGYILVRVRRKRNALPGKKENNYRHKHVVDWEAVNGKIPKGMILRFKDGDKTNISLDNLILITRVMNVRLNQNGYHEAPDELKPAIWSTSELQSKIGELERCAK